jgi:ankyrin repeat protein
MRQTALHIGIRNDDHEFVKTFLTSLRSGSTTDNQYCSINFGLRDSEGSTPLGLAITYKNFDIAEELLKGKYCATSIEYFRYSPTKVIL